MMLSKERLLKEKQHSGYRQEIIEKVAWLLELLSVIADDSYLAERLVLKGGTALNLFHFDLPRLSVDADFNYIGSADRDIMLEERPVVEERIQKLFGRMGLTMLRNPKEHAGGKMVWRYPSVMGNHGNIEVDLNFMYRIPLLPVEKRDSVVVAGKQVKKMRLLDIHELAAGKLTALLERQTGRDFFDAQHLFGYSAIDKEKLRIVFVLYAAMCTKKNMLEMMIQDVSVDDQNLRNRLIPVMKNHFYHQFDSQEAWMENMIEEVRRGFRQLLPFSSKEFRFIDSIVHGKGITPEMFLTDERVVDFASVRNHPALLWANQRLNRGS